MTKYITEIGMRVTTCSCGITWSAPENWFGERENDHKTFFCPNGCPRHFPQDNEVETLKNRLASEQRCCIAARGEANHFERKAVAYKGHLTRLKNKFGEP